jgi:chromosome segregation ATPase
MPAVVWEINVASLLAVALNTIWLTIFLIRASDRSIRAERKADQAIDKINELEKKQVAIETIRDDAKEASDCAKSCKEQISLLNASFSAYREMIAGNYVSKMDLQEFRSRVDASIDKVNQHIDKLMERLMSIIKHDGSV